MLRTIMVVLLVVSIIKLAKEILSKELKKGLEYFGAINNLHKYVSKVYDRYKEHLCKGEDFIYEEWCEPCLEECDNEEEKEIAIKMSNTVRFLHDMQEALEYEILTLGIRDTIFRNMHKRFNKRFGKAIKMVRGIEAKVEDDEKFEKMIISLLQRAC